MPKKKILPAFLAWCQVNKYEMNAQLIDALDVFSVIRGHPNLHRISSGTLSARQYLNDLIRTAQKGRKQDQARLTKELAKPAKGPKGKYWSDKYQNEFIIKDRQQDIVRWNKEIARLAGIRRRFKK